MVGPPIYLNNAATSWPKAPGVVAAITDCLVRMPEEAARSAQGDDESIDQCRAALARLLRGAVPEQLVLTQHATSALNLAILGLGLTVGDEVVTSVTEHNSVLRPLARLEDRLGIRVTRIGLDAEGLFDQEAYERALHRSPRLVVLNHASNVTGRVLAIADLFARAKRAGAFTLLDASQSLGHVPVSPSELHADLIALTGHKGLRGPSGTGGLWVGPNVELEQVVVGGTGVRSNLRLHPQDMPLRLEAGTPNVPAVAGLLAALRWGEAQRESFEALGTVRTKQLWSGLSSIAGVQLFGNEEDAARTKIVSFRIAGWPVDECGYVLRESFGIICRTGLHCAPLIHDAIGSAPDGTVRFSPSGATTESDVQRAIAAVRRMATCGL